MGMMMQPDAVKSPLYVTKAAKPKDTPSSIFTVDADDSSSDEQKDGGLVTGRVNFHLVIVFCSGLVTGRVGFNFANMFYSGFLCSGWCGARERRGKSHYRIHTHSYAPSLSLSVPYSQSGSLVHTHSRTHSLTHSLALPGTHSH